MKYSVIQYATALLAVLKDKSEKERKDVTRRFLLVLRKNRDGARLGLILKEAKRQELQKRGLRKVELESAAPVAQEIKKEIEKVFGKKIFFEETVRPELLGGIKILVDDELLIDASAKRRLDLLLVKK